MYCTSPVPKRPVSSFKKKQKQNTVCPEIFRDEDWLNWRLMECPFNKNIYFFEYRENFAIAHIVTAKNIRRLHILYTFYLNSSDSLHGISGREPNKRYRRYFNIVGHSFVKIWEIPKLTNQK